MTADDTEGASSTLNEVARPKRTIDLVELRSTAGQWIAAADVKASALLAVAGALLAAIAFASADAGTLWEEFSVLAFCILSIASIFASALVLWPRIERKKILGPTAKPVPLAHSLTFFGDLGALQYDKFRQLIGDATDEDRDTDQWEQAFVICVIARRKMQCMRWSVGLLACSLVAIASFAAARAVGGKSSGSDNSALRDAGVGQGGTSLPDPH